MNRLALLAGVSLVFGAPAAAQTMNHTHMTGASMTMPMPPVKGPHAKKRIHAQHPHHRGRAARHGASAMSAMPMPAASALGEHPAPGVASSAGMPAMDMSRAGHGPAASRDMPAMADAREPDIPRTTPPPAPTDHAADRFYDPAAMAAARAALRQEHGGAALSQVMANLAEYQAGANGGGYRWEGQAWFGGDINRLVLTSEGDGNRRDGVEGAELQVLYSRAVTPYFNVQSGVRQDFAPRGRTYATVGVQGLAPYWFDVQAAIFLSTEGELLGRLEGSYDLRLDQRLILQPRVEFNFAARDSAATRTGSGLSNAELGLRLRYEISRSFAPYLGISYDRKLGKTADFARVRGEDPGGASVVAGVRAWF